MPKKSKNQKETSVKIGKYICESEKTDGTKDIIEIKGKHLLPTFKRKS